ncbi:MAG: M67 family metallopeptidase [Burkholderiales bacterium]|nr:M67 family metallopeptidase [Anaerolineae bacterium]
MRIFLNRELQARIFDHLKSAYPNEGGGFLVGAQGSDEVQIQDIIGVENVFEAAEQYHRYAMTPQDWMRLEDEADNLGLTLVGYFHSHPDSPCIPSIYDRDHALPNFVYLITEVTNGVPVDMKSWRLRQDRSQFDQDDLSVDI